MIAVNELTDADCHNRSVLRTIATLLSPQAPHLAEEIWALSGGEGLVLDASWPKYDESKLKSANVTYPVSFNGKVRFQLETPADLPVAEVEKLVIQDERTSQQLDGKPVRKVIVVPGRIVNVVV